MERKFLLPGESAVTHTKHELATLLGSCVSVTLWHPTKHYAAMNHFLLSKSPSNSADIGRYGNTSVVDIVNRMKRLDTNIRKLHARIFGGGAVVENLGEISNIGGKNIAIARQILNENKIKIFEENVSGKKGRRIYMDTSTGKIRVCFIEKTGKMETIEKKISGKESRKVRVLIVDDSLIIRSVLRKGIENAPDMEVCGEAGDAFEANDLLMATDPDVISLDIVMPKMNGIQYLKKLSAYYPKPVVICSSVSKAGSYTESEALKYGAAGVVDKGELSKNPQNIRNIYIQVLRKAVENP